jgi:hypothetical protein
MTTSLESVEFEEICPVFQRRLFQNFPQWKGRLPLIYMQKLHTLACVIALKNDSNSAWDVIESNPFLLMYFGYQMDGMQKSGIKRNGCLAAMISGALFILGGAWSLYVHKLDLTLTHILSLCMGGLGAVLKVHSQKFLHKWQNHSVVSESTSIQEK